MERDNLKKASCVFLAAIMLGTTLTVCFTQDALALDFIDTSSIAVPWSSTFTPLDTAWDSNGTQCVVVGNETNGKDPSAWLYNEPSGQWLQITEGTDPGAKAYKRVVNDDTGMVYATIQLAINNASAGETIRLWSGTYNERITINKAVNIVGNGSANTIINGNNTGTVVRIESNSVNISHVKVTGGPAHIGILLQKVSGCHVHNCSVEGNGDGIVLSGSSDNTIRDNNIRNNSGTGVRTADSETTKSLVGITESAGLSDCGAMYRMEPSGANYSITHNFGNGKAEGSPYQQPLIQDAVDTNKLYGTTEYGGKYSRGTIFTVRKDGSQFRTLFNFTYSTGESPQGLVQSGSYLYSTTLYGGSGGYGTFFRINKDGTGFTNLFNFTSALGSNPVGTMVLYSGIFYGVTTYGGPLGYGTVYRINQDGTGFATLYSFAYGSAGGGYYPRGSLTLDTSTMTLYGMTNAGGVLGTTSYGVIFRLVVSPPTYTPLHSFTGTGASNTGSYPTGGLLRSGTILYGMAFNGGANGYGTLFRINTNGSGMTVLRHLAAADGTNPYGSLVSDAGNLYGFNYNNGPGLYGTLFRWNIGTSTYTILHSFTGMPDGRYTQGSPMLYSSYLYGMASSGGTLNGGTAFSISTTGTNYFTLHNFNGTYINANYPQGKLTQVGNYLYGVTGEGGYDDAGIFYRVNLDGTGFILLREFVSASGVNPYSGTLLSHGGYLYGMTSYGGAIGDGTIYRINLDGTGHWVMGDFDYSATGAYPRGELLLIGSTFYGICSWGGAMDAGSIFKINTDGSGFSTIYHFTGGAAGGKQPLGGLVYDGTYLYGITNTGGSSNFGVLYRINPDGSGFTVMRHFTGGASNGANPAGPLTLDGTNLYGTTSAGGSSNLGILFRMTTSGTFTILKHFTNAEGGYPYGSLTMDGNLLYGQANSYGQYNRGSLFSFNKMTLAFTVMRQFQGAPNDAGYPGSCGVTVVLYPTQSSTDNLILHNNFIDNSQQALDSSGGNYWNDVYAVGGNYWSEYLDVDGNADGIWDTPRPIPTAPMTMDSYPFVRMDGWDIPYATFRSVAYDNVRQRFWICGEMAAGPLGEFYYIPAAAPTTMVKILAPAITFTALATDDMGNVLIGGNDQMAVFYYSVPDDNGYGIVENGTDGMYGWNITGITFNPTDNRFYIVGNVKDQDVGVAFVTDPLPLNQSDRKCYIDTSDFISSPGIGGLKSIAWNPARNYSIAVGDGVYKLMPYDGNPARQLSWSTLKAPSAGTEYKDVSWDTNGWNEAGIVGRSGNLGHYWRYYHSNPSVIFGNASATNGSDWRTCAMKPPSSPKWLLIPHSGGGIRVNILEKDESGLITFNSDKPQIFAVGVWKSSDLLQTDLLNRQVDADATYTFLVEGNYTVGNVDMWSSLTISLAAWYDDGQVGLLSQPNDWGNQNYRTRQFNISYDAGTNSASATYPLPTGAPPPVREFYVHSVWSGVVAGAPNGNTHRVLINVTFGKQSYAADGSGFANGAATGGDKWNKNTAFNDAFSWDMQLHMYDSSNPDMYNITFEEFGIKEFASLTSSGNPTGSAPPGTLGYALGTCTLHYSSNTAYYVSVAIPDLHMNGDPLNPKFIPAENLYVENTHSLATGFSDIANPTHFTDADAPLFVWGQSLPLTWITAPITGTESAGPLYSDYNAKALGVPFEITEFEWWIDVPASISAGTYRGTITVTVED